MVLGQLRQQLGLSNSTTTSSPDSPPHALTTVFSSDSIADHDESSTSHTTQAMESDIEAYRPPYQHAMLAGGIGGCAGDMLMHSLDTVKTRQQGDPHWPPKYFSLGNTYYTIWREEGFARGLYGGVLPAFLGSFAGTSVFFGSYEFAKRFQIDHGIAPSVSYLTSGFIADLVASPLYVPSEVLKTRLQLQGRFNNPYFKSGYNYKSTWDATKTIHRREGYTAFFHGYRATLYRDLPFSALTFAFYEKEREMAMWWTGSRDIGLIMETLVGMTAGGAAGTITCPLDVVKTRIQTQVTPSKESTSSSSTQHASKSHSQHSASTRPTASSPLSTAAASQTRHITTARASTSKPMTGAVPLDTSSVIKGLRVIYRTEGMGGWFRGVGPRAVWTSIQSGTMLVLYQHLLQRFNEWSMDST